LLAIFCILWCGEDNRGIHQQSVWPGRQLALCAGRAAVADIFVRAAANNIFTQRATAADNNLLSSAAAMHCL